MASPSCFEEEWWFAVRTGVVKRRENFIGDDLVTGYRPNPGYTYDVSQAELSSHHFSAPPLAHLFPAKLKSTSVFSPPRQPSAATPPSKQEEELVG